MWGNSHKHKKSKDTETKLGIYDILDKGEKGVDGILNSKSKNGLFTAN